MARRRFIVAIALAVAYLGGWFVLGLVLGVGPSSEPQYVDAEPEGISWPAFLIYGALLGVFVGLAVYAAVHLLRQRGVRFRDLDGEEQRRREEAGRLLHDL
jgi:hypothetical protein